MTLYNLYHQTQEACDLEKANPWVTGDYYPPMRPGWYFIDNEGDPIGPYRNAQEADENAARYHEIWRQDQKSIALSQFMEG